jgi:glycosyltransferase
MLRVSIITPTLNSERTLADTLRSVAAQQCPVFEHLIIDGGSTDSTLQIAGDFAHVTTICSEPDRGLYDAVNKGLRLATGDVIGILNSDDFYAHDRVLLLVAEWLNATGAEALYADLEYVHPTRPEKVVRYWKSGRCKPEKFQLGWMPPHPTFFVRKSVYDQYGAYNADLQVSADYELMLRFLFREKISVCYLPEVITRMRAGGLSNARLANRWRANREDRRAWRLNGLKPPFYTLLLKPVLKIRQFII